VSLLEDVAKTAAQALLNPLVQELALYISGKTKDKPKWLTTLPTTLRSELSLKALKARNELLAKGSVTK
jgi:hypothetical protein